MDKKETENYDSLQYVKYYDSLIRLEEYNHKIAVPYGGIGVQNPEMNTKVRYEAGYGFILTPASLLLNIILIIYFAVKIVKNIIKLKNKPKYVG
ncbi:MAG: hypothetical protein LBV59_16250 [Sphingobacterium sp.]|jgi:hypothetical protein|uniref:hypothetical protein n=1 Tax=Sphingobacterium sp. TaxID=341027 RepID=UPI0028423E32|nr:hypothetical protein [Sphingobacterium sp.]MDR3009487.1 hypothetical protein [Sphingobacterium sp.]